MPGRKKAPLRPRPDICPQTIDRMRQSYVATITRARAFEAAPDIILDKATALLTQHWGKADWTSRAAILKSVDWLLRVAIEHPAPKTRPGPLRAGSART